MKQNIRTKVEIQCCDKDLIPYSKLIPSEYSKYKERMEMWNDGLISIDEIYGVEQARDHAIESKRQSELYWFDNGRKYGSKRPDQKYVITQVIIIETVDSVI